MDTPRDNHENYSDDGNLSDIDKEWMEIQKQYNEAETNGEQDELVELLTAEITDSCRRYNLPRVIDSDPAKNIELGVAFINTYREKVLEELQWQPDVQDSEARSIVMAFKAYQDRRDAEMTVIYCALAYKLKDIAANDDEYDDVDMLDIKSNLLAHFQVHYKLEPEWLQFFHDVTNEYEYTPYYEAVETYHLEAAWESLPGFLADRETKWRIFDEALRIAGVNDYSEDTEYVVSMTAALIDLIEIAQEPVANELDRVNRNESLWECGREAGLELDLLKKLADYFDNAFPPQD